MKFTISDFRNKYPNSDACLAEIMRLRYGKLSICPSCKEQTKFHRVKSRQCYECQYCGKQIYPMKGTPFQKTTTPLSDWFYVIYLMTATRSGVSAMEVQRQLGVTYKCAWRMCHQIRKLMGSKPPRKLRGHVEVDETYVGGVRKGGGSGRGAAGKTVVFGMVERQGEVRAMTIPNVRKVTILPLVAANVEQGSKISSDELHTYDQVSTLGYEHGRVKHKYNEYVNKEYHTQSVEGFWSQLKRGIRGTHVWVSGKHLNKYVDEFSFRFNTRNEPATMFDRLLGQLGQHA